jgi:hypothetical protein
MFSDDGHSALLSGRRIVHAARRAFCATRCLLALAMTSSSSPAQTAAMRVSMTDDSLSFDGTMIAGLPFSNSTGLLPNLIDMNR